MAYFRIDFKKFKTFEHVCTKTVLNPHITSMRAKLDREKKWLADAFPYHTFKKFDILIAKLTMHKCSMV